MQNRRLPLFTVLGLVAAALIFARMPFSKAADATPAAPIYAQLSSPDSQLPTSGPLIVKMSSNDALAGLTHSDKDNLGEIKVQTAGAYFMVAAIQVGKDS